MSKASISVEPLVLTYARQVVHIKADKVASHFAQKSKVKFGVTKEFLKEIETNKTEIPFGLLQEFSILYQRPLSFFFITKTA